MAEPTLKSLKGPLQRSFRHLVKAREDAKNNYDAQEGVAADQRNSRELDVSIKFLESQAEQFESALSEFERLASQGDDDEFENEQITWSDCLYECRRLVVAGKALLEECGSRSPTPIPAEGNNHTLAEQVGRLLAAMEPRSSATPTNQNSCRTKLPTLELPKFKGDILKWKPFWDRFEASVQNNSHLANVDKLSYLLASLEGEAHKMVEGLAVTNDNYTVAVQLLKKKFEDTRMVVSMIYRKLNELSKVRQDVQSLRAFSLELDRLMGSLEALGQDTNDDNFVSIIMSKLPISVCMQLELLKDVDAAWTVSSLREKLSAYLTQAERAMKVSSGTGEVHGPKNWDFTGDGLFAGEERSGKQKKSGSGTSEKWSKQAGGKEFRKKSGSESQKICAFCQTKGSHWSDECRKFPTSDARFEAVKRTRLCTLCLSTGHKRQDCRSSKPCFYCKRVQSHHSALCFNKFGRSTQKEMGSLATEGESGDSDSASNDKESALLASGEEVLLQTAQVTLKRPKSNQSLCNVRALLDPGANRSYCSEALAKKMNLKLDSGPSLAVNRFGSSQPVLVPTRTTKVVIVLLNGKEVEIEVAVIPKITGNMVRSKVVSKRLRALQAKITLADYLPDKVESSPIHFLIGSDHYLDFVTGEKMELEKGLYLLGSEFGFILTGRVPGSRQADYSLSLVAMGCDRLKIDLSDMEPSAQLVKNEPVAGKRELSDIWDLESLGIAENPQSSQSESDKAAIRDFQQNVNFVDGRYSVSLPFNENVTELQSHYELCVGRLRSLLKRLTEKPDLLQKYDNIIKDQLEKGVIEVIDKDSVRGRCHYIPHHAVVTPQKETTKVRVVYDGSAKVRKNQFSLNECLHRGPVYLEDLAGLIMRFRLNPIAILADVEKAFLQIGVNEDNRDTLRFLWLKNLSNPVGKDNILHLRFTRVPFGTNASPALLAQTILHHLQAVGSAVSKQIAENLYVDNVVTGVRTLDEAKTLYQEAKGIFNCASMNLREWTTNSKELETFIPSPDRAKSEHVKVLGLFWDIRNDQLSFQCSQRGLPNVPLTKRDIVSKIYAVFDPLGLVCPCLVQSKRIMQRLTEWNTGWDDEIPVEIKKEWYQWLPRLESVRSFKLPRLVVANPPVSLIVFCDASETAFAATVYLKSCDDGAAFTNVVMAKSRLNPIKRLSIPRSELMAIVIGIRLLMYVRSQIRLDVQCMTLFSDSMCALAWLQAKRLPDVFTTRRVQEIAKKAPNVVCRYVHTSENPADIATRGKRAEELGSQWWQGPPWLCGLQESWPVSDVKPFYPKYPEPKPKRIYEAGMVGNSQTEANPPFGINPERFSSLKRLIRVSCWCQRFVSRLKNVRKGRKEPNILTTEEVQKMKLKWICYAQEKAYAKIKRSVLEERKHEMSHMGLFLDEDGILRKMGRLSNCQLEFNFKFPILMPSKDKITELIIWNEHEISGHPSPQQTFNLVQRGFCIPRGRSFTKTVLRNCVTCKKAVGKPYALPPMPELPKSRVCPKPSFEASGVDYFGPVKLKCNDYTKKAWVCLFTCLVTRAVHLELVEDLSTDKFLLAFRRFMARRGKPKLLVSDNGPQFKQTASLLPEVWQPILKSKDVMDYLSNHEIHWSFITEYAPYMGGAYERMVGTVKTALRKTVGQALLSTDQFNTILCECESLVNSRPLTFIPGENDDVVVLTPAHFLNPIGPTVSPEISSKTPGADNYGSSRQVLIDSWVKGQNLLDEFWKLWSEDYLNALRSRNTYVHKHSSKNSIRPEVGHLVLIVDKRMPRGKWKIAKVVELDRSRDHGCRGAKVRLTLGTVLHRPLALLVPFEITSSSTPNDVEKRSLKKTTKKPNSKRKVPETVPEAKELSWHRCEGIESGLRKYCTT